MIRAPFALHTVPNTDPAQAAHTKLYLAPFAVWRRRVFAGIVSNNGGTSTTRVENTFDYVRPGQYIGSVS